MKIKQRFRPLFEWIIRQEFLYNLGKTKSRLGFVRDAVLAGGFAATIIQNSLSALLISLAVSVILVPLCWCIGTLWKRSGLLDYELDYTTKLNPYFRRNDKNRK